MNVSNVPDRPGHDALWEFFGLSHAAWLVLPRVLLHEMPDEWQLRLANLLNEMEDTFPGVPCFDYVVVAKDSGKFARLPEVLCNYRHPDREAIGEMRSVQSETEVFMPAKPKRPADRPWIGVDLDGTLAEYHGWQGPTVIGEPVPMMLDRVHTWLRSGQEVRIVTARVSPTNPDATTCRAAIVRWLYEKCGGISLQITHEKDFKMTALWDDRCVQVIPNTGRRADRAEGGI